MTTDVATAGGSDRFVLLATLGDQTAARICAALLESEGIAVRLHGEGLGPYPMTVGAFATTQLWVPEGRLDAAKAVMLEAEVADVLGAAEADPDVDRDPPPWVLPVVAATIVAVVAVRLVASLW